RSLGAVFGEAVPNLAFGRLAARALRGPRHPLLAQEDDRRVHLAVRLLQRLLGRHHPRAGAVAQLLDEARCNLGHYCCTSSGASTCTPGSAISGSVSDTVSSAVAAGASAPLLAAGLNSLTAIFC